ncbi:restriction endonuclease subunit S [Gemmatimonas sp.]|uniref:restriction endonuclease subunit S n=1 Tax=Gemmatimonas sp. TaxID=1962908 RepID=UPI003F7062FE
MTSVAHQSEVLWTGAPPATWATPRVKDLFLDDTGTISVAELASLEVEHYSIPAYDELGAPARESGEAIASNKKLLRGRELLFSKLNSHKPRVWLVPTNDATKVASTEFIALREWHAGSVSLSFCRYLLGSATFAKYISCFQTSVTNSHRRINSEDLFRTRIPLPPLAEQQRIATFLDGRCTAIDAALATKRLQLETLQSVRSSTIEAAITCGLDNQARGAIAGCDWLDLLPSGWTAVRIKRVLDRIDYGISESTETEGAHAVLKMGNIQDGEIVFTKIEYVDEVSPDLFLAHDDLLYNRTNSPDQVAKAAIFRGEREDEVTFASYLVRLRVNHRILPEYLNFVVNSAGFLSYARRLAIPSVQQSNLNSTRYGRIMIPLPSVEEQRRICESVTQSIHRLRGVEESIEAQVSSLLEYRRALIHECITGTRRVSAEDVIGAFSRD